VRTGIWASGISLCQHRQVRQLRQLRRSQPTVDLPTL